MVAYCNAVWRCRYFWLSLVQMDLRSRYRGSVLGMGWSLVFPLCMTAIFTTVFCRLFHQDPTYFAPYVLIGLSCWAYFLQTSLNGCLCFYTAEQYIRQHPAPLAIYPLRVVLGTGFHFLIALTLATLMSAVMYRHCTVTALLSLPVTLVLLFLLGWSLGVLTGLAHTHFRDTKHIVEILFQILFYLTPVFYNRDLLAGNPLVELLRFNPFVPFLDMLRKPLLHGVVPETVVFTKACLIVVVATSTAVYALSRLERRLVFHL